MRHRRRARDRGSGTGRASQSFLFLNTNTKNKGLICTGCRSPIIETAAKPENLASPSNPVFGCSAGNIGPQRRYNAGGSGIRKTTVLGRKRGRIPGRKALRKIVLSCLIRKKYGASKISPDCLRLELELIKKTRRGINGRGPLRSSGKVPVYAASAFNVPARGACAKD